MAKCPICQSRKGKRVCLLHTSPLCTPCCGEIRQSETCSTCEYYQDRVIHRKYHELPAYSTVEMENSFHLQDYSNAIESAFVTLDSEHGTVNDAIAREAIEYLFDKYLFQDQPAPLRKDLVISTARFVEHVVQQDIEDPDFALFIKVLGTVYQSVCRRTQGGREYMRVIAKYVGVRVGPGEYVRPLMAVTDPGSMKHKSSQQA